MKNSKYKQFNIEMGKLAIQAKTDIKSCTELVIKLKPFIFFAIQNLKYPIYNDNVQEAYVGILEAVKTYKEEHSFLHWIFYYIRRRLIMNLAASKGIKYWHLRDKKDEVVNKRNNLINPLSVNRKNSNGQELIEKIPSSCDTSKEIDSIFLKIDIDLLLTARTSTKEHSLIHSYFFENKTYEECGKKHGVCKQYVYKVIKAILIKLEKPLMHMGY